MRCIGSPCRWSKLAFRPRARESYRPISRRSVRFSVVGAASVMSDLTCDRGLGRPVSVRNSGTLRTLASGDSWPRILFDEPRRDQRIGHHRQLCPAKRGISAEGVSDRGGSERLIDAARKRGRNGPRDAAAILLAYRHGLRAAELCQLRWAQIDLRHGRLHVNRAKGGIESVHPLHGPELRALRPLQGAGPYVFVTEAGTPTTTAWFLRMVRRTGRAANSLSRSIRTCYGIRRDTSSLTTAMIRGAGALSRSSQSAIDCEVTALAEGRFAKFWQD